TWKKKPRGSPEPDSQKTAGEVSPSGRSLRHRQAPAPGLRADAMAFCSSADHIPPVEICTMWLSRRTPKQPHRTRRSLLLVEQLEKRQLLNGSPMPALPQASSPISHSLAEAASLAEPPADRLLPSASDVSAQGWAGASQLPGLIGPPQKTPVPSNGPLVSLPL